MQYCNKRYSLQAWRHTYTNYRDVNLINCGYETSAKTATWSIL